MSTKTDTFASLLKPFGLSDEEAQVYLFLLEKNFQSALEIHRSLKIARTKVYRILDKLHEKGLVAQKKEGTGLRFGANSPQQLELLVAAREQEVQTLRATAPMIMEKLAEVLDQKAQQSETLYYTGREGLKQALENALEAKDAIYAYEMNTLASFVERDFAEEFRKNLANRKVVLHQLTNKPQLEAFTQVERFIKESWQVRYLEPHDLKIEFEVLMYNDVYVLYSYKDGDVFCLEVHNEHLAKMQKQLFLFLWQRAQRMKMLDDQGSAIVDVKIR